MKIENGVIRFECLSAFGSGSPSAGEDVPVTAKASGEAQEAAELEQFKQMGRNALGSFSKLFA